MSKKKKKATEKKEELQDQQSEKAIKEHSEHQNEETNTTEEQAVDTVDQLNAQLQEANDKYLRLYAEFENFRRRTAKERLELIANAGADIMKELLPVLDDMERAMDQNKNASDADTVKEGFELVYNKLKNTLTKKGLKEMDSKETTFDTDHHEAITKIPAPSEEMKGKVVDVVEKGYFLHDKVLRYAKVVIGE